METQKREIREIIMKITLHEIFHVLGAGHLKTYTHLDCTTAHLYVIALKFRWLIGEEPIKGGVVVLPSWIEFKPILYKRLIILNNIGKIVIKIDDYYNFTIEKHYFDYIPLDKKISISIENKIEEYENIDYIFNNFKIIFGNCYNEISNETIQFIMENDTFIITSWKRLKKQNKDS